MLLGVDPSSPVVIVRVKRENSVIQKKQVHQQPEHKQNRDREVWDVVIIVIDLSRTAAEGTWLVCAGLVSDTKKTNPRTHHAKNTNRTINEIQA